MLFDVGKVFQDQVFDRNVRGVGTELLRLVLAEGSLQNLSVSLSVSEYNSDRRLYERAGFVPVGALGDAITRCCAGILYLTQTLSLWDFHDDKTLEAPSVRMSLSACLVDPIRLFGGHSSCRRHRTSYGWPSRSPFVLLERDAR